MKTAEQIFGELHGFQLTGNNVSISITKGMIYEAMEEYASQTRWIPCSEFKIEMGERYLVDSKTYGVQIGWKKLSEKWEYSNGGTGKINDVEFIQPLPDSLTLKK